jgi:hypothetical protein
MLQLCNKIWCARDLFGLQRLSKYFCKGHSMYNAANYIALLWQRKAKNSLVIFAA